MPMFLNSSQKHVATGKPPHNTEEKKFVEMIMKQQTRLMQEFTGQSNDTAQLNAIKQIF